MIVLGIDPGTASTGYGVVAQRSGRLLALDGGVIETPAGVALERRLTAIHARVRELLDEHAPAAVAIEDLYFGANARSAMAVGQARGVVLLAAGERRLPCGSYTPQQVKSAVCGSGRADKAQVQQMVQRLLSLPQPPAPDHAADALAVAICHLNRAPLLAAGRAMPPAGGPLASAPGTTSPAGGPLASAPGTTSPAGGPLASAPGVTSPAGGPLAGAAGVTSPAGGSLAGAGGRKP